MVYTRKRKHQKTTQLRWTGQTAPTRMLALSSPKHEKGRGYSRRFGRCRWHRGRRARDLAGHGLARPHSLRRMISMKMRALHLVAQSGTIDVDLFFRPRLRGSVFGEKPHAPPFYPTHPVVHVDRAGFFESLLAGPRADRPFVDLLVYVHKSGLFDTGRHGQQDVARPPGASARL